MNRNDIDTLWQKAMQESVKAGELFTRYHFAALVADVEAKRIHDEGMVTVGHMREQIAAERKACAKISEDDDHIVDGRTYYDQLGDANATARNIATAIRARGSA